MESSNLMNISFCVLFWSLLFICPISTYSQIFTSKERMSVIANDVVRFRRWKEYSVFMIAEMEDGSYTVCPLLKEERFIFTPEDSLGSRIIQYDYIDREDRLFLWRDTTKTVSVELIDILSKYDFLDRRPKERIWYLGENTINNDGQRMLQYWFCPNSAEKFSRRFLTPHFQRLFNNNRKRPPRLWCK